MSGPERTGSSVNPINSKGLEVRPGEDSQADMSWGGARAEPYIVHNTGQVITGACWVYSVRTNIAQTNGTLDLYNGTSTGGDRVFYGVPAATIAVAGFRQPVAAEGTAAYCANGLYAVVGAGSPSPEFVVWALAAQPS